MPHFPNISFQQAKRPKRVSQDCWKATKTISWLKFGPANFRVFWRSLWSFPLIFTSFYGQKWSLSQELFNFGIINNSCRKYDFSFFFDLSKFWDFIFYICNDTATWFSCADSIGKTIFQWFNSTCNRLDKSHCIGQRLPSVSNLPIA